MKLCPHCKRRMPVKQLTLAQINKIRDFYTYLRAAYDNDRTQYASAILNEFKAQYPSFKGSQKLILRTFCQLGCRLDSIKVGNKTMALLIIK